MHLKNIKAVVEEINAEVAQRPVGSIYQLPNTTTVIDFRSRAGTHLLISVDPKNPRIHLVTRKLGDLKKSSVPAGGFVQVLRSTLRRAELITASAHETERIVKLVFQVESELGETTQVSLLAQLTGRSANLFLLNDEGVITRAFRPPHGDGQQVGGKYLPPPLQNVHITEEPVVEKAKFPSLSAALDAHYLQREAERTFNARVEQLEKKLRQQIRQKEKLRHNLEKDLHEHGDADQHKRLGDLLLANISTAEREGDQVRIRDYYAEGEPVIELTLDKDLSLQEHANRFFKRYTKGKRAVEEIKIRMARVDTEIEGLRQRVEVVQDAKLSRDEVALAKLEEKPPEAPRPKKYSGKRIAGVRRYLSSDNYEILVGRAARTNDQLTFKIARPNDLWFHAADYSGSHVVIRNHDKKQIPHRTIIEAAQLAAKFSQAAADNKVDVHYTARKFLAKPKGAAPGLVRLSQFKTITVTPKEAGQRLIE